MSGVTVVRAVPGGGSAATPASLARRIATEAGVVLFIAPVHAVAGVSRIRYDHAHVDHRVLILGLRRFGRRLPGVAEQLCVLDPVVTLDRGDVAICARAAGQEQDIRGLCERERRIFDCFPTRRTSSSADSARAADGCPV